MAASEAASFQVTLTGKPINHPYTCTRINLLEENQVARAFANACRVDQISELHKLDSHVR